MYKNEKSLSFKNIKIKEDLNKKNKYTKINTKFLLNEKSKIKNNISKCFSKINDKEKSKSQKLLNGISKLSKKTEQNNRNLNRIDITMNFNMTNFTTYNDTNKKFDKKFIDNYSGKKEAFHKRQISDGFQKIKVINTGNNFLNIKVNTKDNKTNTYKQIQNMKKINNKNKIIKSQYINYDIRNSDEMSNSNNYIYNSYKDLTSYDNISKLKINISETKIPKEYQNVTTQKLNKIDNIINNNSKNINLTKSAVNLKKKEKIKNSIHKNNINNNNPFNNNILKYKAFKDYSSESTKIIKTDLNKKILKTNPKKDKMEKNKNNSHNKYSIILPNDQVEIFPIYINTNTHQILNFNNTNLKYEKKNSYSGLNNIKINNIFKKQSSYKTSRKNTNRGTLNFTNYKNKKKENDNNIDKNNDKENANNPEEHFFNIIKMIQKSKNSAY